MNLTLCLIILYISGFSCLTNLSNIGEFVSDILRYKNIKFVTFYTCFKQRDTAKINKILNQLNVRSSFIKPSADINSKYHYEKFNEQTNLAFILDVSCEGHEAMLNIAGEYSLYKSYHKWLIIDTYKQVLKDPSFIFKTFNNIRLRMDSDLIVALSNFENNDANISLYDVYNPGFNRSKQVKVTPLGFWAPHTSRIFNNIVLNSNLSKYEQRKDMTGLLLKSGIVNPHMGNITSIDAYYQDVSTKNLDTINKLSYALFTHIHEIHNFTLQLTLTNMWYGGGMEGGMDAGLAKLLYEKAVDFGTSCSSLKSDRIPFYDYVSPTYPFRSCFLFRNPGISSKIQNEFLKPFDLPVWFYILGYMLLFCVVLKSAFFAERMLFGNYEENSWTAACLLTWAVFCQQGATFIPKPTSGRCTLLTLLVLSLLLYNYYTSSIVSSLLSGLPPPFSTIEELTDSDLDVGAEDVIYVRTLFETATDPTIKRFYSHKMLVHNKPSYVKVEEGIRKVKAGGYAYHIEASTGYQFIEAMFEPYEICDLAEIDLMTAIVLWVYAPKHSQYSKLFAIGYLKMRESGIMSRQQSTWITKKPTCFANTHLVEVGMQHVSPAFLVLLLGLLLSAFLLILEKLWDTNKELSRHLSKLRSDNFVKK